MIGLSRRQKSVSVGTIAALLVVVTVLDTVTGHHIDLSIAYFLPIVLAAWAFGRWGAVFTALVAEIPTYFEQMGLIRSGDQSVLGAIGNGMVRLLIYLFVAEVTTRLLNSREEARFAAGELHVSNENLQTAHDKLDDDARAGGLLQMSALAFTPPVVPGCEVGARVRYAQALGGDLVDTGVLDGKLYVCVADISGKGTPAALFTILLKHLLSGVHRRGMRGITAVAAVNDEICHSLPLERFVTLFYAEVDPNSGEVSYVNAGHPDGVIFRQESGTIELAPHTCPLLGYCDISPGVQGAEVTLGRGDVLVLYTDGATEAKTRNGERLGDEFIQELTMQYAHLDAQEMADAIVGHIEEITQDGERDDIAVVCVKMIELPEA